MAEKNLKARIVHKHDVEANWLLATGFTPKQGEIIVYDIDDTHSYERFKIGDGVQNVNDLPFYNDGFVSYNEQNLTDEQKAQARENIGVMQEECERVAIPWAMGEKIAYVKNCKFTPVDSSHELYTAQNQFAIAFGSSVAHSSFASFGNLIAKNIANLIIGGVIEITTFPAYISKHWCDNDSLVRIDNYVNVTGYTITYFDKYHEWGYRYMIESGELSYVVHRDLPMTKGDYDGNTFTPQYFMETDPTEDKHVSTKKYVDDSVSAISALVGDTSVSEQINNAIVIATDDEIIELLAQEDMLPVVKDSDGSFLADENENILLW